MGTDSCISEDHTAYSLQVVIINSPLSTFERHLKTIFSFS